MRVGSIAAIGVATIAFSLTGGEAGARTWDKLTATATGGYPDAAMPCAHPPYAAKGTGYWCKNYDWGPVRDTARGWSVQTTFSKRGYGYRNCTDYVAWRLEVGDGVPAKYVGGLGNGGNWSGAAGSASQRKKTNSILKADAAAAGVPLGTFVNTTPAVGSAAIQ